MQRHLEEISANVAVGAHAVLLFDRAGWHTTLYKFLLDLTDGVGWPFEVMARLIARPR